MSRKGTSSRCPSARASSLGFLLDTSVLIDLRDEERDTLDQVARLPGPFFMAVISLIELEGGVWRDPKAAPARRARLDQLVASLDVLNLTARHAEAYGEIVAASGYSRRKLLDRMIAAQALVQGATLVTRNPADFRDVPGLDLLAV